MDFAERDLLAVFSVFVVFLFCFFLKASVLQHPDVLLVFEPRLEHAFLDSSVDVIDEVVDPLTVFQDLVAFSAEEEEDCRESCVEDVLVRRRLAELLLCQALAVELSPAVDLFVWRRVYLALLVHYACFLC